METITPFLQGLVCLENLPEICLVSEAKELRTLQISLQQSSTLLTYNTEEKLKSPYLLEEVYLCQAFIDHRNSLLRPVFSASWLFYSWDVLWHNTWQQRFTQRRVYFGLWFKGIQTIMEVMSVGAGGSQSHCTYIKKQTEAGTQSATSFLLSIHPGTQPMVCCSESG